MNPEAPRMWTLARIFEEDRFTLARQRGNRLTAEVVRTDLGGTLKTYSLAVVVVPDQHEDGREAYQAYCPDIEEAVTWGDTREEALRRINELLPERRT